MSTRVESLSRPISPDESKGNVPNPKGSLIGRGVSVQKLDQPLVAVPMVADSLRKKDEVSKEVKTKVKTISLKRTSSLPNPTANTLQKAMAKIPLGNPQHIPTANLRPGTPILGVDRKALLQHFILSLELSDQPIELRKNVAMALIGIRSDLIAEQQEAKAEGNFQHIHELSYIIAGIDQAIAGAREVSREPEGLLDTVPAEMAVLPKAELPRDVKTSAVDLIQFEVNTSRLPHELKVKLLQAMAHLFQESNPEEFLARMHSTDKSFFLRSFILQTKEEAPEVQAQVATTLSTIWNGLAELARESEMEWAYAPLVQNIEKAIQDAKSHKLGVYAFDILAR